MRHKEPFQSESRSLVEQASAWRLRIETDAEVSESEGFQAWFADPVNRQAYARVCATWDVFEDHLAAPQLIAVRRDALARARRSSFLHILPGRRRLAAIAAILLLACASGIGAWRYSQLPAEYRTGIGERRAVMLEDGSRVSLDSNSAVQVRYTKSARLLVLERGRARFDVTHNVNRPFSVNAGGETVVAVGTSFDVEKLGSKVLVTLIEGRVVVKSSTAETPRTVSAPAPKPVTMTAGQQLVASVQARPIISPTSLPVATAWEAGRLILNDEPLGEAVERVNRYTDKPLAVDPAVADLRISGVFNAGDVNAFIDAITNYFPVQASTSPDNQIVLQKRS
jgi:transmembrane sensor